MHEMIERRAKFRIGLNSLFLPYYDELCRRLDSSWQPYMGDRSFKAQGIIYAQGRTTPGKIVTKADAGKSPHCYGCATDWVRVVDGVLVWLKANDPAWAEYVHAVQSVGLRSGIEFGDIDHCELKIAISWEEVLACFREKGADAAQALIASAMLGSSPTRAA